MANIRNYIEDQLLEPLKSYPTTIQHTILETIIRLLENLYEYTVAFPEIVSPGKHRLDILKTIADQFMFNIRDEADLQEQIDILSRILEVYNKRGSIDTIEHMWKYYGGDLPKDVQVVIPSYNLFRYNISAYSRSNVFQDSSTNRTGVYEIKLSNNTYPISELKTFLLDELVAAGNFIYFSNILSLDVRKDMTDNHFDYLVKSDDLLDIQMTVSPSYQGINLSGPALLKLSGAYNETRYQYQRLTEEQKSSSEYADIVNRYNLMTSPDISTRWSGKENIFIDIVNILESVSSFDYIFNSKDLYLMYNIPVTAEEIIIHPMINLSTERLLYCTPSDESILINSDLYNDKGEHLKLREYFILDSSLLGDPLGYDIA